MSFTPELGKTKKMTSRSKLMHGAALGALALLSAASVAHAQQALPQITIGAAPVRPPADPGESTAGEEGFAPGFSAARAKLPIYRDPPGQTVTIVNTKFLKPTPLADVRRVLEYSPGVSVQQGNNARDLLISIRGSGNRAGSGFPTGIRNIMLYEDGFPITTADGNSRTDLLDPHSFAAVDVYRGPSSALFGNYAYGGAINFRTFSGRRNRRRPHRFGIWQLRLCQQLRPSRQGGEGQHARRL